MGRAGKRNAAFWRDWLGHCQNQLGLEHGSKATPKVVEAPDRLSSVLTLVLEQLQAMKVHPRLSLARKTRVLARGPLVRRKPAGEHAWSEAAS